VNPFIFTPYNEKHPRPLLAVVDGSSVQFFRLPGDKRKAYGLTVRISLSVALDFGSFAPLPPVNTPCGDDPIELGRIVEHRDEPAGIPGMAATRDATNTDNYYGNIGHNGHDSVGHSLREPILHNGVQQRGRLDTEQHDNKHATDAAANGTIRVIGTDAKRGHLRAGSND